MRDLMMHLQSVFLHNRHCIFVNYGKGFRSIITIPYQPVTGNGTLLWERGAAKLLEFGCY